MKITREFTKQQILESDNETVDTTAWRHGTRQKIVFEVDGAHWSAWIDVHHDDGWQIYGAVTATKVHRVEKTVVAWEPVEEAMS